MSNPISYSEAMKHVRPVKPFTWVNRNITVTDVAVTPHYHVFIVVEPGYNGEIHNDNIIIFSKRGGSNVSKS